MKTRILVEIEHDRPFKTTLAADLPNRLERCAFDYIQARGFDLRDVSAHHVSIVTENEKSPPATTPAG